MVAALRVLFAVVVASSLCVIAAYVVGFTIVTVVTVYRRGRSGLLPDALDQALEEILGQSTATEPTLQRSRGGRS
jgi:hypothetical protein